MKVISGFLKGRTILGYTILGTRPTMDRVKESIFSMIQDNIQGKKVLDLFAGSGNYGIESISNGASLVYFNDFNKQSIKVIKENLNTFNCLDKAIILNEDYLKCLKKLADKKERFDLIFLDPPYRLHVLNIILEFLINNNMLNENSLVVCEFQGDKLNDNYQQLEKIKERKYGEKEVYIYKWKGRKNEIE